MNFLTTASLLTCLAVVTTTHLQDTPETAAPAEKDNSMELGNFSVSLAVKDLKVSRAFYEKLGFKKTHGDEKANYLIMQNETATIGLFQGMFEVNILTFNPGWDRNAKDLKEFTDVRDLQKNLKGAGIDVGDEVESESGPASFTLTDPDGNVILVDQHADSPKK
jgi:lactoylglutathione lyase